MTTGFKSGSSNAENCYGEWQLHVETALKKENVGMPDALVFEGGGILGIAYPSALRVASEQNALQNVCKYAGASAGSLVAGMLACGANIDFLEQKLDTIDYAALFDSTFGFVRDACRFYKRGGYARGAALRSHIEKCLWDLTGDASITFADVERRFGNELKVVTTSMTERRSLVFDALTTPDYPVANALVASSSFPLAYPMIDYCDKQTGRAHKLWDGGLLNNFPIQLFDEQRTTSVEQPHKRWPNKRGTLGFKLLLPHEKIPGQSSATAQHRVDNVFGAVRGLLACWSDASARVHLNDTLDWPRTLPIRIPIPLSVMDFALADAGKQTLKRAGRESALAFFESLKKR